MKEIFIKFNINVVHILNFHKNGGGCPASHNNTSRVVHTCINPHSSVSYTLIMKRNKSLTALLKDLCNIFYKQLNILLHLLYIVH